MRVAGLIVALSFVDAFRRTDHAARGSLWKRFDLTAKRASQIGGLVLEYHMGRYGHWRHGGGILLRQAARHLDENRHCDSGTGAWLALLLNRQQHFDLYAHSARRAPLVLSPGGVLQPLRASLSLLLQRSYTLSVKLKAHTVIHFLTLCRHGSVKVYLEWRLSWPTSLMKSCCIAAELHSSQGSCSQPRA